MIHFFETLLLHLAEYKRHEMRLRAIGADFIIRETLLPRMSLAENLLVSLDITGERAAEIVERFYGHDRIILNEQFAYSNDQERLIQSSKEVAEELEGLFAEDKLAYLNKNDVT